MAYIVENDVIVAALTKQLQTLSGNEHVLMFDIWIRLYVCLLCTLNIDHYMMIYP